MEWSGVESNKGDESIEWNSIDSSARSFGGQSNRSNGEPRCWPPAPIVLARNLCKFARPSRVAQVAPARESSLIRARRTRSARARATTRPADRAKGHSWPPPTARPINLAE